MTKTRRKMTQQKKSATTESTPETPSEQTTTPETETDQDGWPEIETPVQTEAEPEIGEETGETTQAVTQADPLLADPEDHERPAVPFFKPSATPDARAPLTAAEEKYTEVVKDLEESDKMSMPKFDPDTGLAEIPQERPVDDDDVLAEVVVTFGRVDLRKVPAELRQGSTFREARARELAMQSLRAHRKPRIPGVLIGCRNLPADWFRRTGG